MRAAGGTNPLRDTAYVTRLVILHHSEFTALRIISENNIRHTIPIHRKG